MLTKYIELGDRLELQMVDKKLEQSITSKKKIYISKVNEFISEDRLEITMPMEKTKLILLPVDEEYDVIFHTKSGLYQCFATIVDRYKRDNIYILVLELNSDLRKHQRREFYRFNCALKLESRVLEAEEILAIEKNQKVLLQGLELKESILVDISGGGIRFVSEFEYERESYIYITINLALNDDVKQYQLIGKVLYVNKLPNKNNTFEHRVQFVQMDSHDREEIIRFIFEEERKNRKREKGL